MGNNPLWLGIQPAHHSVVDMTTDWGWEEKARKMKGWFVWGVEGVFYFHFYSKKSNPKELPEAPEVTYVIQLWIMS